MSLPKKDYTEHPIKSTKFNLSIPTCVALHELEKRQKLQWQKQTYKINLLGGTGMSNNIYGVEIIEQVAYTEHCNRSETAYGKNRNDFEGSKEECLKYISSKNITEIVGILDNTNENTN